MAERGDTLEAKVRKIDKDSRREMDRMSAELLAERELCKETVVGLEQARTDLAESNRQRAELKAKLVETAAKLQRVQPAVRQWSQRLKEAQVETQTVSQANVSEMVRLLIGGLEPLANDLGQDPPRKG